MKYPMLANYLQFEENKDGTYTVIDRIKGYQFEATREEVAFAMQLDGKTNPLSIVHRLDSGLSSSDALQMLNFLEEIGAIRHNRILEKSFGSVYYSLFIIRHRTDKFRTVARAFNYLLRILYLPVLVLGLFLYISGDCTNEKPLFAVLGGFTALIIGGLLHELSHAAACHGFGGTVCEFGACVDHFVPAIYTFTDNDKITSSKNNIRILSAGVEMDFLFAGIFFLLASQIEAISSFTFGYALTSVASGVLNCLFLNDSDGTAILEHLFEADDIFIKAKKIVCSKQLKHRLRQNGFIEKVAIMICYVITVLHFLAPVFAIAIFAGVAWGIT